MENYNRRWIDILYFFLESNTRVSGDSIALSVGVSSRTIRNDIKELNLILKEYEAEISSEIGAGYILEIKDQNRFQIFLEEIKMREKSRAFENIIPSDSKERTWYITSKLLMHSLNQKGKIESSALEEELFISDSTLRKDLRSIDRLLKKYDLKISETKKAGLRVVGEEAKIRFCIAQYIFNNQEFTGGNDHNFYEEIFCKQDLELIRSILTDAIIRHDLKLTDIAFKNLVVHSLIMLKRSVNKSHVKYNQKEIQQFTATSEFRCAKDIIDQINAKLDVFLWDEAYYLTQHLISSQKFLIEDLNGDYIYKTVVLKILEDIKQGMHIDLSDDAQLINGLAIHLSAALQRLRFAMNIRNEFLDELKNSYPLAFELAVIAGRIIEKEYGLMPNEAEIGFLTMHFGASLERKGLNEGRKKKKENGFQKKKVALVCVGGVAMALLLKEKLLKRFGNDIEIVKTCPAQSVSKQLVDEMDLVLTTVDLPGFHENKIKKIRLFLNDDDFARLSSCIEDKSSVLDYNEIFKEELFYHHMDFKDKYSILEFITNKMLNKGYITDAVKASIFKREEMATTELGSLVAIPHALLNDMEDMAVSVMILKKPILWEDEKVQVILLLNIPKKKYDMWTIVFKNLYQYLIGCSGVKRLIKYQNYHLFISDLQNSSVLEKKE